MKIIKEGLLPPDDPIFTGRVEFFTIRKPEKPPQKPKKKRRKKSCSATIRMAG